MLPDHYKQTVLALKSKIRNAQSRTILSVNIQLLAIYWEIGEFIVYAEQNKTWGSNLIDQLSIDLKTDFPEIRGLSPRNLRYMRSFYRNWPELHILLKEVDNKLVSNVILQQPVAKLPWGHICILNDRLNTAGQRTFYAGQAANNNWSRNVLINQIDSKSYERYGKLQHNFKTTLPVIQGDLANELFKDPYKFDFLQLSVDAKERDIEDALITHIQRFLVELGKGFAFCSRQERLEKGGQDYYIDLLFYHTKLHSYIVIELKVGDFKPEYAGKMNFYLSVVDEDYRTVDDNPSIGIILCKNKNKVIAEYALRNLDKPVGIAQYNYTDIVPEDIKGVLPSIEDLETALKKSIEFEKKPFEKQLDKLKILVSSLNHEELQEKINVQAINKLFIEVLQNIKNKADLILKTGVYSMFESYKIYKNINNETFEHYTSADIELMALKRTISSIGLTLKLNGFKKDNTQFSLIEELTFYLSDYFYEVGNKSEGVWQRFLYHQSWNEKDFDFVAEKFIELITTGIINRLEMNQSKHSDL